LPRSEAKRRERALKWTRGDLEGLAADMRDYEREHETKLTNQEELHRSGLLDGYMLGPDINYSNGVLRVKDPNYGDEITVRVYSQTNLQKKATNDVDNPLESRVNALDKTPFYRHFETRGKGRAYKG